MPDGAWFEKNNVVFRLSIWAVSQANLGYAWAWCKNV